MLFRSTNRFFLLKMVNIAETGLYGVAFQVASILSFFAFSFNNAYVPWLFNKLTLNEKNIKITIVKLTYYYFIIILILGLLLYFIATPLIFDYFINKNYNNSLKFSFLITMGFVFQGMYLMVTNYINYSEKTHYQAIVTIFIGVLNIPMNYYLINIYGSIGAAVTFCLSYILLFIFTWIMSYKAYKMPWLLNRVN